MFQKRQHKNLRNKENTPYTLRSFSHTALINAPYVSCPPQKNSKKCYLSFHYPYKFLAWACGRSERFQFTLCRKKYGTFRLQKMSFACMGMSSAHILCFLNHTSTHLKGIPDDRIAKKQVTDHFEQFRRHITFNFISEARGIDKLYDLQYTATAKNISQSEKMR